MNIGLCGSLSLFSAEIKKHNMNMKDRIWTDVVILQLLGYLHFISRY